MTHILMIKVVPSAGKRDLVLDKNGTIKCFIKSPPEKGKANRELIRFLADKAGVTMHEVHIMTGLESRTKKIAIESNDSRSVLLQKLGLDTQLLVV